MGELSLPAQAKLLRALQEQEFERVGGTKTLRVDVRVIAATNRDLREAVKAGRFRSDLYYRINVFPLEVPPLRERREDIPLLARHFLRRFAKKLGKPLEDIGRASMERLSRYAWPGNIRELQNVIERAAVLAPGPIIEVELRLGPPGETEEAVPLNGTLEELERAHIQRVLQETGWLIEGKQGAATRLGLSPPPCATECRNRSPTDIPSYPVQPPEPTIPLGPHPRETPKRPETWRLDPMNGQENPRSWTEDSRA